MKKIIWTFLSIFMILIGFTSCSKDDDVAVSGISLDKTSLSITKGETAKLNAVVSPSNATNQNVTWRSSNNLVAAVDQDGNVTATGSGTTEITATAEDGKFQATCIVTVVINASSITLSETNITIEKGKTTKLNAIVKPDDATYKTVNWQSSNASVAMVDQDGVVTAIGRGSTVITAASADGKCFANCIVNVLVDVESITISKEQLSLVVGQTYSLYATILPKDATDNDIKWTSSNNNVVSVDNGQVTAKSPGTAIVSAISQDGEHASSCTITVTKSETVDYNPYGDGQKW